MVFDNVFGSAGQSAGLFSVRTDDAKPEPGEGIDFEDSDESTYDDRSTSLFSNTIHGATSRAKIVREDAPEARALLGLLGAFIQSTQASAGEQARYAADPGSVSAAASAGMREASGTVSERDDLQKDADLENRPSKDDFTKPPKAPDAPKAAKPGKEGSGSDS
ncbi:hypothetical protein [Streptomyces sp. SID11385]|uniref:hypothetical protein n=1 Tax=Streptomyces sp. SID11385 TaxID=2706031 RepID=UPI0013C7C194|nr:hypothetical protein [Streptomyces sp. SID11385]NEA43616.1 hypothetical protein [Streptomyces sp. SID11385]